LENDALIQKLESLKKDAASMKEQLMQTDVVLEEIREVQEEYEPLARMTS